MIRALLFITLSLLPLLTLAQSDEFIINTLVGIDTEAPTTPTGVVAIPVSANQIDVSWNPSTDNFAVGGYRIVRDGFHIATTTLTTFNDTGLTPSTTYSYTIDAFDVFYNFSSTSAPVATTTFALPAPVATSSPTTTSPAAATAVPALRSFTVTPAEQSAKLDLVSYGPTRYVIRFGRTDAYELGSVSTNVYKTQHEAILSVLEPGTTYFFEVTLINGFGVSRMVRHGQFTTLPAVTSSLPVSVFGLRGVVEGKDAVLTWINPDKLASVRVVRSHLFYPADIYDGVTVYQGAGDRAVDRGVFEAIDTAYYSVFAITKDGRVAAPAVLRLSPQPNSPLPAGGGSSSTGGITKPILPDMSLTPAYERFLLPSDIFITAGGETRTFDTIKMFITGEPVLVSIPLAAVPNHLKTILVSVYHPTNNNEITTYLLKLRGDGAAYEATFEASGVVGEGKLLIELYDYERVVVRRISRTVSYVNGTKADDATLEYLFTLRWWYFIPVLILVLLGFFFWTRRRREDNQ